MKLFQVTIPNDKHRKIVSWLQDELELDNVTSVEARTSSIVQFRVEDNEMLSILTNLQKMGVGIEYGFCDVMSLTPGTTISTNTNRSSEKKKRRLSRLLNNSSGRTALSVAEMYDQIEANSALSKDSFVMLLISSSVAGIGLAADSPTYVVASMLISPLMGPILACSFGFAIRDKNLFITGLVNEFFALVITLLLGGIIGALLAPYADLLKWPTNEMRSRGQTIQLIFGAAVAAMSGIAVGLAECNANISSVVGTAIAAALLPPTVNCGICLAYALLGQYFVTEGEGGGAGDALDDSAKYLFFEIAVGSALLVWVNLILIYLFAVLVFKIKEVGDFHLIRNVDEQAWQNLPKIRNTPRPGADLWNHHQALQTKPQTHHRPLTHLRQRQAFSPLETTPEADSLSDLMEEEHLDERECTFL